MAQLELQGKGAIVTGAGSGINLAFAKELYFKGCNVLIVDVQSHPTCSAWIAKLPPNTIPRAIFYRCDVTDWKQLELAFRYYELQIGGVPDLVCPGAGIYEPSVKGFWSDQDKDGHYHLLDVNLVAPIKMMRIAIRKMLQANKPGVILHVSSTGAQKSSIVTPLYQCSKHGISSFVRAMAPLHGMTGIKVVGVAPGLCRSPLFLDHPKAMRFIDENRDYLVEPEEVARGMIAVATDPKYVPGTILEVTGPRDLGNWREVHLLNDPGPQGWATTASNKDEAIEDIRMMLESERRFGKAKL